MFSFKPKKAPIKIALSLEQTVLNDEMPDKWLGDNLIEGRLALDVYDAGGFLLVKAAMAAVTLDDLDISLHNELLTIKGKRQIDKESAEAQPILQECYWGNFSRGIVLPCEVDPKAEAYLESGLLTIKLKKIVREAKIKVKAK